jgi:hypothetical protein
VQPEKQGAANCPIHPASQVLQEIHEISLCNVAINRTEMHSMKDTPLSVSVATGQGTQTADRARREQELYALWKTNPGQRQVLHLLWTIRGSATPLRVGDSVFQLILDHEFGPLPA